MTGTDTMEASAGTALRETEALDRWPELRPFVREIVARYGDRLHAVLLYGSRARGEAREDSDYDLSLVFNGPQPDREDREWLSDRRYDIMLAGGPEIGTHSIVAARLADPSEEDFYARNVAIDGIALVGTKP